MEEKSAEKKPVKKKSEEHKVYADLVEQVFLEGPPVTTFLAKYMKVIINLEICFSHIGYTCVFIVFVGENMAKIFHYYDVNLSVYVVMLIFIVPMWLSALITNLKLLAPVSALANVILVTALVVTFYLICDDLPPFNSRKYVAEISSLPLFLTVALYSFDSAPLVVSLRNEMDNPKRLVGCFGVLNVGFLIVIPIVVAVGLISYLQYGEDIEGTVFLNMSEDDRLVQALIVLVCLQILFTYPIILYVPVTTMWPMIVKRYGPFRRPLFSLLCFRTVLVLLTLVISEAIPFIDLVISLIGAIASTCISLFIPAVIEIIVFYNKYDSTLRKTGLLAKNILIIVVAALIFSTGLFISVTNIVNAF